LAKCGEESYVDFAMNSHDSKAVEETSSNNFVTGVCHAKGSNSDMPAVWLPYFLVADIELAVTIVQTEGGQLTTKIRTMGDDKFVVIKDPAGAQCALYQKKL